MKTGICGSSGRQPASGLTPRSFCSAIIAVLKPCLSAPYCLRSFWISGWISCIARWDFTCFTNSRNSSTRMVMTRKMIDNAQLRPPAGSRKVLNRECQVFITQEIAVYSQSSNASLLLRRPTRGRRGGTVATTDVVGRRCRGSQRVRCRCARRVSGLCGSGPRRDEVDPARVPRRALGEPAQGQPAATAGTVHLEGLDGVGAAAGHEPAPRRERRADGALVEPD